MQLSIPTINGALAATYSKQAAVAQTYKGHPIISFPVDISDVPAGTHSLAFTFVDHDAIPVGGFTWIHWIAANLPATTTHIPENASQTGAIPMVKVIIPQQAPMFTRLIRKLANTTSARIRLTRIIVIHLNYLHLILS